MATRGPFSKIPPRILVKLEALSTIDFSKLTRINLRERIQEIKQDLQNEFSKVSTSSALASDNNGFQNPNRHDNTAPNSRSRSPLANHKSTQPSASKNLSQERAKKPQDLPSASSGGGNRKSTNGSTQPSKPSYAELLKMAESRKSCSLSPQPESPEARRETSNMKRSERNPAPESRRSLAINKPRDTAPSRNGHRETVPSRNGIRDSVPRSGGSLHSKTHSSQLLTQESSRSQTFSSYQSSSNPHASTSSSKNQVKNSANRTDFNKSGGPTTISRNTNQDSQQRPKERQPKRNKKAEEEALEEKRRQRLREEEERVRLRNMGM